MKRLELFRSVYTDTTTIGRLFLDGEFFGWTLEDAVRPPNIKIQGKTAIPEGTYKVVLSMSNRFKKVLPEILSVPHFSGIRFHGGNTAKDTEGCVLIAGSMDLSKESISGSLSDKLVEVLTGEELIYISIVNLGNV